MESDAGISSTVFSTAKVNREDERVEIDHFSDKEREENLITDEAS